MIGTWPARCAALAGEKREEHCSSRLAFVDSDQSPESFACFRSDARDKNEFGG